MVAKKNISKKIYYEKKSFFKKHKVFSIIIILFFALVIMRIVLFTLNNKKNRNEKEIIPVESYIVKKDIIRDIISLSSRLLPESEVQVFSPVTGWLDKLYVSIGSKVSKRQIVATVDRNIIGTEYTKAVVKSPIRGEVSRVYLDIGATVSPTRPIMSVVQYDNLKLEVNIPEKYIYKVHKGDVVLIHIEELPEEEFIGKINKLSDTIDPMTATFQANIYIPNKLHKLKPGLFADIKIVVDMKKGLVIPVDSILNLETDKPFVYVIDKDKKVKKHFIKTGIMENDKIEVKTGLKKNDEIVVTGKEMVKEEVKVNIVDRITLK